MECTDKSFVTTGLDEKDEAMVTSMVSSRGGLIKSSVSDKTDYLIVDDDISWQTVKYILTENLSTLVNDCLESAEYNTLDDGWNDYGAIS